MQIKGTKIIFQRSPLSSLVQLLPALFFIANLYMRTGHSSSLYMATLIVTGMVGLLTLLVRRTLRQDVIYITVLIYFISGLFNLILIGNVSLTDLANDALLFGIMVLMFACPMDITKGTIFFYVSVSTFIYAYFTGIKAHSVLTSSGNYVSVLLILSAALYYVSLSNSKSELKLVHLLPAVLCFLLSVWAKGRGGILSSAVLMLLLLSLYLFNYAKSGGSKRIFFFVLVMIGVIGCLFFSEINIIDTFFSLGKWSSRGFDNTSRELIWGAYYDKVKENFLYIFSGAPLDQIPIIHSFDNNTHNSLIQLHANNGLIPFILFVVIMIRSLYFYIRKNELILGIVLFTIFVRGMSDKFIFGQYGMPIMMYLVLLPYVEQHAPKSAEDQRVL